MAALEAPYYPIIYVRGYAMGRGEIDDTTADPFCGFNLGSTVYRAVSGAEQPPRKFVFESPIVRLMSEFQYSDVYEDGRDIVDPEWQTQADGKPTANQLGTRSIIIHRYYDSASNLFGSGKTPKIETFARELAILVEKTRDLICSNPANNTTPDNFKCYLVAHSMGGLVCRAFLQNPALDPKNAGRHVDKLFTYATPHNGIDLGNVNVPRWLTAFDVNNFDRDKRMPEYLDLKVAFKRHKRVDLIPEDRFPSRRVFCMVGTNRMDYEAAAGLARTFVGHGSDGLVQIKNATLQGLKADGSLGDHCAKAFAFRSHSGFFGIVNSEEAFQNLARFLFGDVRVDMWLDIEDIRLPPAVDAEFKKGRKIDALYQVELLASPRGKLWYLSRRMAEEDSVACFTHANWKNEKSQYLSTAFLANRARVNPNRRSLSYSMTLGVRVPDYEIEKKLWINEHYEGGYLFRNAIVVEMTPPNEPGDKWKVSYAWQDTGVSLANIEVLPQELSNGEISISIPFNSSNETQPVDKPTTPGIKGNIRFVISAWR